VTSPTTVATAAPPVGRPVPGPSVLAFLRSLPEQRRDVLSWVHEHRARYGDVFASRFPRGVPGVPDMILFACEPASVREILTDSKRFVKGSPVYDELSESLGDGLLTREGDTWKGQRRTLQPLFTRKRIEDYTDAFLAATTAVSDAWEGRGSVELVDEREKVTLGSVSRALFGTDVTEDVAPIVAATDEMSGLMVQRGMSPVAPPRWVPTPVNLRIRRLEDDLRRRTAAIVAEAAARSEGRDDLVARLQEAVDPETGEGFDQQQILEQALIFLLAGYDTTSTALAFTLHELGALPELQAAVRAEIAEVVGDRQPTAEDAAKLELTQRCLLEGMRLHPPAYITSRTAAEDTTIDGWDVPEGTVVTPVFSELHRNAAHWPDPDRFDPDRFLPEAVAARDRFAYLPFGAGPRKCIGEHFAILEATLALAILLHRWEVTTLGGTVPMRFGITQRSDAPVHAMIAPVTAR
jgi:cytochrome P450